MGFVSLWFLLFLIILLPVYYLTKKKYRWISLLIASVVFYALCSYKSIVFLLFTTVAVYFSALAIHKNKIKEKEIIEKGIEFEEKKILKKKNKKIRKVYLILGVVSIVIVLSMMKYMNFMIDNINLIGSLFNVKFKLRGVKWILPLGISFYTFQAIGYLADVYWGKYDPEKNFFKFFLFMIFFPKIMQGPIIRYNEIHDLKDVSPFILDEIKNFFENYKTLQNIEVKVTDYHSKEEAIELIEECKKAYREAKK